MISCIVVSDCDIQAVNRSKEDTVADCIVYRDTHGHLHKIDLEECARNYAENTKVENRCIGERDIRERCFILYTSGIPTKIVFDKPLVFRFFGRAGLYGSLYGTRDRRFLTFEKILNETKYRTRDLS